MRTRLLRTALPLGIGLALLLGWVVLGRRAADDLRDSERYALAFADVECEPPGTLTRTEFLGEVQYLSAWPDRVSRLDEALAARMADAFLKHPWVESVERIELLPRAVQVRLVYRMPVLTVAWSGAERVVDGNARLLPIAAAERGLPILDGSVSPPAGGAGTPWGDVRVEAAARTAAVLRPHRARWSPTRLTVEAGEVWLLCESARVRWGHAPGRETAGEPAADRKIARLLEAVGRLGGLGTDELDLRDDTDKR